ncbi:MAG: DUF4271 domain-containing protein [Flavobacteriales bacterium]
MQGDARFIDPLTASWVAGLFLSCVLILATVNIGSPRKWRVLRQAAFRARLGQQTLREEVDTSDRNVLGLLAVGVAAMAMLLWQSAFVFSGHAPDYWKVFLMVVAVLFGQALLLRTIAAIARADAGITEYIYTGALLHAAVGIVALPVSVLAAYQPVLRFWLIALGLGLLAAGLLYRWLRGALISLGEGVPLRFLLLYICAAEIGPLALALSALRSSTAHLS